MGGNSRLHYAWDWSWRLQNYLDWASAFLFGEIELVATVLLTSEEACVERPRDAAGDVGPPAPPDATEVRP